MHIVHLFLQHAAILSLQSTDSFLCSVLYNASQLSAVRIVNCQHPLLLYVTLSDMGHLVIGCLVMGRFVMGRFVCEYF